MTEEQEKDEFLYGKFPAGFKFGVGTSAYQTEGAWNLDGKGESIWDAFCHDKTKRNIEDGSSGDIACDSYHRYKEDVQLVKNMGASVYRFSVAWTRILPNGTPSLINQAGIDYYNRLIDELISNGIEPVITLFHWDTPASFEGGWLTEDIVPRFGDYARICFAAFGDRVKTWATLNEPLWSTICAHSWGTFAPGNPSNPAVHPYLSIHNMLKAHATAYHIYKDEFKGTQNGRVGISLDSCCYFPKDPSSESDVLAAERSRQFRVGWLAHPIYKGDYPPIMREYLDRKSKAEGRAESRLPQLGADWIAKLKGSSDFLGINHYTSQLVTEVVSRDGEAGWMFDQDNINTQDPAWPPSGSDWLRVYPYGIRSLLQWLNVEYGNPEVIITENGVSSHGPELQDKPRVEYFRAYMNQVLKAVKIDGCNVTGYFAWSLLDVFEWSRGYQDKFGVHAVDFDSPERTRTPKDSAKFLAIIFKEHGFLKE